MLYKETNILTKMTMICCVVAFATFAEVHPGLKLAVDEGDIKTAENLVKKVGVEDIYCPSSLPFSDAMKIYGKTFETKPEIMWEKCDADFVEKAKSEVCKKSVSLCKYLLNSIDVYLWTPYLNDIVKSKLNQQSEKRNVQKDVYQKISKKECLEDLSSAKDAADVMLAMLQMQYCDGDDAEASAVLCGLLYAPTADSIKKFFKREEKKCRTNPTRIIKKEVAEKISVNPFSLEIAKYGEKIARELKSSCCYDEEEFELYNKLKSVKEADSVSMGNFVNEMNKEFPDTWEEDLLFGCMAFDEVDGYIHYPARLGVVSCDKIFSQDERRISWLSQNKEYVIQDLMSIYAKKGEVPDSLKAFACRMYNVIDKDIKKKTGVKIFDCEFLKDY